MIIANIPGQAVTCASFLVAGFKILCHWVILSVSIHAICLHLFWCHLLIACQRIKLSLPIISLNCYPVVRFLLLGELLSAWPHPILHPLRALNPIQLQMSLVLPAVQLQSVRLRSNSLSGPPHTTGHHCAADHCIMQQLGRSTITGFSSHLSCQGAELVKNDSLTMLLL